MQWRKQSFLLIYGFYFHYQKYSWMKRNNYAGKLRKCIHHAYLTVARTSCYKCLSGAYHMFGVRDTTVNKQGRSQMSWAFWVSKHPLLASLRLRKSMSKEVKWFLPMTAHFISGRSRAKPKFLDSRQGWFTFDLVSLCIIYIHRSTKYRALHF